MVRGLANAIYGNVQVDRLLSDAHWKTGKGKKYELCGKILKYTTEEKDTGVIMHNSLKPIRQCAEATK